jgi:uncharacterized protein YndB with AHSA1/START domain
MTDAQVLESGTTDAFGVLIEPTTLKIQRRLPGPIDRVWSYIAQSELRRQWLAAGAMEMKPDASFTFTWRNDELTDPPGRKPEGFGVEHSMEARIVELDPPRKLVITWQNTGEVSFELEEVRGEVLLTIIHRRFANRDQLLKHAAGWHMHLDVMAARITGETPTPFWDGWTRLLGEYEARLPA